MLCSHFRFTFPLECCMKKARKKGGSDNDWELSGPDSLFRQVNYTGRKRNYAGVSTGSFVWKCK